MNKNELNSLLFSIVKNINKLNNDKLCKFVDKLCALKGSLLKDLDQSLLQNISDYLLKRPVSEKTGQALSERIKYTNEHFDTDISEIEKKIDHVIGRTNFEIEPISENSITIKNEELKIERLKIYAKIVTVLISVVIGTLGVAIVNSKVQQSKIDLQREKDKSEIQKTEMTYLGNLLKHALTDDNKKRFLFSEYYAELTVSEDLRKNWIKYHEKIAKNIETYEELKNKYDIAREKGQISEVEKLLAEIKKLQKGLEPILGKEASLLKPRKIVHLSDLNIGLNNDERRKKIVCIVDNLIKEAKPSSEYLVIITGDLVDEPTKSNFQIVKEQIDRLETSGFIVLLVPGNHDYGTKGNFITAKQKEIFTNIIWNKDEIQFPKVDIIDNIAFIGLDTMGGRTESPFEFATGILGKSQLERLDSLLNSDEVISADYRVVYMHHSPFAATPFMELKDANILKATFQKHSNIDAMLFGNSHQFKRYLGIWNIKRSYDAGSSTADNIKIRIIDVTKDPEYDTIIDLGCKSQTMKK